MKVMLAFAISVFFLVALPLESELDTQESSAPDKTSEIHTGKLKGRVTDSSGQALKNVTVILKDSVTHEESHTTTNKKGSFEFSDLFPGTYSVSAEAKGYKSSSEETRIQNGSVATVNLRLANE